jgi:archaellum component FlaC
MWWLVGVLLLLILGSFVSRRREGLDDSLGGMKPDDPTVKQLLQTNERTLDELTKKVDALAPLAEQVTSLKRRVDESNTKLDGISNMCVKCTA